MKLKNYLLHDSKESAAFLIAGIFSNKRGLHFVIRDILIPEEKDYDHRSEYHIRLSALFFNKAISIAEKNKLTIICCHSHPFSKNKLSYSLSDEKGESASAKTIAECLDTKPMGSLLFSNDEIIGRVWTSPSKHARIDQLRVLDGHMRFFNITEHDSFVALDSGVFDRQIRLLGTEAQKTFAQLTVGIIGLGRIGSSVAEQLTRLGVRDFILIDHDKFEPSNKTRLFGSYANHTDEYKVDIDKEDILNITPNAEVLSIPRNVISQDVLKHLKDCDVIFSCTDRHSPRGVLSELSYQYYIPMIDLGVGLAANENKIQGSVRSTVVGPSLPCLFCSGIIDPARIQTESMSKKERQKRQKEGYIEGIDDNAPSVISFTNLAACFGLLLFKDLLLELLHSHTCTIVFNVQDVSTFRLISPIGNDCVH
jgi:hypothetical protein